MKHIGIFFACLIVTVVTWYFLAGISYNNQDVRLRNALTAKESAREAVFDETWKSIKQIAQVSEKYANDFKKVYPEIMGARYGNKENSLLNFVTEANPTLDTSLYNKLANVIEAKRSEFTSVQKQLVDLKREHDNLITTFPGTFFIRNLTPVEVKVISSDRSKEVRETGIDNDVNVFSESK